MCKRIIAISLLLAIVSCTNTLSVTEKRDLVNEIDAMGKIDQVVAYIPQGKYANYSREKWNAFKDSVMADNTKKAELLYKKYGYLGFDKVGEKGETQFWAIVQHSDKSVDFQNRVLKSLKKEVRKNNASSENYALLYDRIKINNGEKQLFGTQVEYKKNGQAIPKKGLVDTINIDKLRKKYNLDPLKKYLNLMTERHFNINKEILLKDGITEPIFYK
ncbi:hypothetical protein KB553_01055 [Chryseobacterium rhizoplanae]|uniref:DUF6624 domain-containing protein n=1 Tax=Chryseobacterium rhizoplanae TaxID=1609531 RepID=UPI001CE3636E|nr:DUF6624 domain-containing protein [Chryseobacterium rhizoplanae]UCA60132.1 hypothetical protein KB553_01055 [Chryseobacterium rhizoplanae]